MTELHAVSSLQERYDLSSRQAVYDRLAALNIKPVTRGKLDDEQLSKLDQLNEWLKANPHSAIADFPQKPEVMPSDLAIDRQPSGAVDKLLDNSQQTFDLLELAESFARHLSKIRDPLQHYAALERAIASSWLLSTAEVRSLIGTNPTGDRYQRGSFVFIRSGKIGAQLAWRVSKVVSGGSYKV